MAIPRIEYTPEHKRQIALSCRFASDKTRDYYVTSYGDVYFVNQCDFTNSATFPKKHFFKPMKMNKKKDKAMIVYVNRQAYRIATLVINSFTRDRVIAGQSHAKFKDGDYTNCKLSNLQWESNASLVDHARKNLMVKIIINKRNREYEFNSIKEASDYLYISPATLRHYLNGTRKPTLLSNNVSVYYKESKDIWQEQNH